MLTTYKFKNKMNNYTISKKHYNVVYFIFAFSFIFPVVAAFLHLPFGRLGFVVAFFSFLWLYTQYKSLFLPIIKSPASFWLILMIYHYINLRLNINENIDYPKFMGDILPCFILYFCAYLSFYSFDKFIKQVIYLYLFFIILADCGFILGHTYDFDGRIGLESFHPNILAQYSGYFVLLLSIYAVRYKINYVKICLLMIAPILLIFYCESRNSFAILFFAIVSYIVGYGMKNKISVSTIIKILIIGLVLLFAVQFVLNNTALGDRLLGGLAGETAEVKDEYFTGTIFDTILGERVVYYVLGFDIFPKYPICGIGLWKFIDYNPFEFPFHTEYMVHLVEGGIIGFLLYILFIGGIIILFMKVKYKNYIYYQLLICLVCLLVNGVTARIFPYNQFFPIFGIIIGYLKRYKNIYYENCV